jgi:ribonuclease HII
MTFRTTILVYAGVDEAGRGPLAGPVVAAAVILDPARPIRGLADSKVLAPERREVLAKRIRERATAFAVALAAVDEIDTLNILQASMLAMQRAVEALSVSPEEVLVDGNCCPKIAFRVRAIVGRCVGAVDLGGVDPREPRRDAAQPNREYPAYGFARQGLC